MVPVPKVFPNDHFELFVRSYMDNIVDWEVVHNFAMAHIDDPYLPEFQRPMEDLHMMFLPEVRFDAESVHEKPQIRYLLDLLDSLKEDVEKLGRTRPQPRDATDGRASQRANWLHVRSFATATGEAVVR